MSCSSSNFLIGYLFLESKHGFHLITLESIRLIFSILKSKRVFLIIFLLDFSECGNSFFYSLLKDNCLIRKRISLATRARRPGLPILIFPFIGFQGILKCLDSFLLLVEGHIRLEIVKDNVVFLCQVRRAISHLIHFQI